MIREPLYRTEHIRGRMLPEETSYRSSATYLKEDTTQRQWSFQISVTLFHSYYSDGQDICRGQVRVAAEVGSGLVHWESTLVAYRGRTRS